MSPIEFVTPLSLPTDSIDMPNMPFCLDMERSMLQMVCTERNN